MVASSGMAAITTALLAFLRSGDHLLIQNTCYGGTYDFVTKNMPAWNISHTKIDASQPNSWREAIRPSTKVAMTGKPPQRLRQYKKILTFVDSQSRCAGTPDASAHSACGRNIVMHSNEPQLGLMQL